MSKYEIKTSEKSQKFQTGAVRGEEIGKIRLDLISPIFEARIAEWLRQGAIKYEERNWEKGIPTNRSLASCLRHINAYRVGDRSEDHLSAAAINLMFIIHTLDQVEKGLLPKELDNIPTYVDNKNDKLTN